MNKIKYIPQRMCIACREMHDQSSLIRVVKEEETAVLDMEKKRFGRGAYICKNISCIEKAQKKRLLERHLKCVVREDLYKQCLDIAEMKKG